MAKLPPANDATPEELVQAIGRQGKRAAPKPSQFSFSSPALREFVRESIGDATDNAHRLEARYGDVNVLDGSAENVVRESVHAQDDKK